MNNTNKEDFKDALKLTVILMIVAFLISFAITGIYFVFTSGQNEAIGFGGYCPIKIYQVYDKDTGVYYAVTEQGGICVMQTANGEVKLVDQGNGEIIHPNQGELKNVD